MRWLVAGLVGLCVAALVAACSGEGALPPTDPAGPDGGPPPDASSGGAGGQGGATPAPKRTLLSRNPFGNVAARENLLWDGDFEWSSPFSDQYGWYWGPPFGFEVPPVALGARCKSGIKCMTLPDNDALLGLGVGTTAPGVEASVWVWTSNESSGCVDVDALLTWSTLGEQEEDVALTLDPATPGPGWCRFAGAAPERKGKLFLYVENQTGEGALVDDAVVLRLTKAPQTLKSSSTADALDPEVRTRARAAVTEARKLPRRDPPPDAKREAFQQWLGAPGKRP